MSIVIENIFFEMKKVMLVDDQEISNFIMRKYLNICFPDLEVVEFTNPAEALDALENQDPDVVFLDLNMPLMNGWQFLDTMGERNLTRKVLVLSSSIDPMDAVKAGSYKYVVRFCEKPLNKETLPEMIEEAKAFKIPA